MGALVFAFAAPASGHHLVVTPPGGGNGTDHWVGGPPDAAPLPESATGGGLHDTPFGTKLPAAHSAGPNDDKGLVQACLSTRDNPVVEFIPPPPFLQDTDCMHGEPLP